MFVSLLKIEMKLMPTLCSPIQTFPSSFLVFVFDPLTLNHLPTHTESTIPIFYLLTASSTPRWQYVRFTLHVALILPVSLAVFVCSARVPGDVGWHICLVHTLRFPWWPMAGQSSPCGSLSKFSQHLLVFQRDTVFVLKSWKPSLSPPPYPQSSLISETKICHKAAQK